MDQIEQELLSRRRLLSEPEVWRALIAPDTTAGDVRKACRQSRRWLNPKWAGRPYVLDLYDHAEQFIRAKEYQYYPRRDSSDMKRVMFFARTMTGITLGISPVTAIDRLRKMKHGSKCPCVNCDKERWDRLDRKIYKLFFGTRKRKRRVRE